MKGFDKFQRAIIAATRKDFRLFLKDKKKFHLLAVEIEKELFTLGPPTPPHKPTGRQRYLHVALHHFTEIMRCSDTLGDIEFYVGQFPYGDSVVKRHRHLQFLVESYLQEMYVCEQRLLQYLTVIERQYRKDSRLPQVKATCTVLKQAVLDALSSIVTARGSHVHRVRFSDAQLDRLSAIDLALLIPYEKDPKLAGPMKAFYLSEYRKARKSCRQMIKKANVDLRKLLDIYFERLFPLLFGSRGEVCYPSHLKF